MPHQVFVSVTEQVIALGAVRAEIKRVEDTHQFREPVLHLLPATEFTFIIEISGINDTFEVICLGESCDDFVDFIADFLVALECRHIREPAAFRHDKRARCPGIFIRDIFHKQQRQDVVFILRGIHPAAELVAALPEGGIKLRFFKCHVVSFQTRAKSARLQNF